MKIEEAKILQKTILSTCSIKEKNTIIFKEDLPTSIPNFELHVIGLDFDEALCVQAIADKFKLKVRTKDYVTIISTPKD